jgi:protein SCO1/2
MSSSPNRSWVLTLAAAAAALLLGAGAALYWWRGTAPLPEIGGYVLPVPQALPAVSLVDEHGQPFAPTDFAGHWSFLYFGYTYCPDVCPLALIELANLKKRLAVESPGTATEYYLVSVDPARDAPERLQEYVTYFDPSFRGLTGSVTDLTLLAKQTGSVFFVPEGQDPGSYLVSHSSNIALLDPEGRLYAVFTSPHAPAQLAEDFGKVLGYYAAIDERHARRGGG